MAEPQIFEQRLVVLQEHLDDLNHVNNVQYLQWVQDIAKGHWEKAAKKEWLVDFVWVVLNHFIEYKKPALLGDKLLIQTHVNEFKGPKSNRFVRITNEDTNELVVQASTWWCMLDAKSFRPARITASMLDHYENPD
ncbi:acyl-CoA thioesterase [Roseivirga sp.]|uniref:acyl-CoA thioesterase n=1 Tax=Roseivirga sp. TaxID=1964215 RepID=UPI003B8D4ADD